MVLGRHTQAFHSEGKECGSFDEKLHSYFKRKLALYQRMTPLEWIDEMMKECKMMEKNLEVMGTQTA